MCVCAHRGGRISQVGEARRDSGGQEGSEAEVRELPSWGGYLRRSHDGGHVAGQVLRCDCPAERTVEREGEASCQDKRNLKVHLII